VNVLFLSQIVPYPPHGGVLQRGYNLLRELGARARVHLLAFVHTDILKTPGEVEDSKRALGEFCSEVEYFPLWVKQSASHMAAALGVSLLSPKPFGTIAHRSAAFHAAVDRAIRIDNYDVLHVDTLALEQFVPARSGLAAATVLTHHNIESLLMARRAAVETRAVAKAYLNREARKLRSHEAAASPRFDVNVLVSKDDEILLRERVPGIRTTVVPNGVDTIYFSDDRNDETATLIYTGGMGMFANLDAVMHFLSDIWPRIKERHSSVRFVIVGRSPTKAVLDYAAQDPRVVVTGFVDDIRPLVRQAAVYVVPLRVGGGTRLKVLDAMAMGKAMVSTSVGCEGLAVQPGAHLEVADSPEAFAAATLRLLQDPARRRALGGAARRLVERSYAWPAIGGQLVDGYQAAIDEKHRRS
jgi:glycosyltransferase involved in cell wall biosynthesis